MFDPSTLILLFLTKQLGVVVKVVFIRNLLRNLVNVFNETFCFIETHLPCSLNLVFW